MPSYNRCVLIGHMTRDPQLKTVGDGKTVAEFGLAVNDVYSDDVMFIDVAAWGKTAENTAKYCGKGSAVLVDGRLKLDQWEDRETGAKRSKHRLTADNVTFLPRGDGDAAKPSGKATNKVSRRKKDERAEPVGEPISEDNIPF